MNRGCSKKKTQIEKKKKGKGFVKNVKKQKYSQKLHTSSEYNISIHGPNGSIGSLTEEWWKKASLLGNT